MKLKIVAAIIACLFYVCAISAETKGALIVKVFIESRPLPVSPEGFVDGNDKWLQDSKSDLKDALDGKWFHPKRGYPGSKTRFIAVSDASQADITLTVAGRGTSIATLGQRTTATFYRGVVLADTVPTVGVTRWVSIVLSAGNYRREFLAWSLNQTAFSAGAWTKDAHLLALEAASWVMANDGRIRERQGGNKPAVN